MIERRTARNAAPRALQTGPQNFAVLKGNPLTAEFASAFQGVVPDRKLTARELRMVLAAEEEAVHLYEALADATDNQLARAVLQDIADGKRVHVGEFHKLRSILLPDEDEFLADGAREVDEMAAGQGD